jgi:hypothetical protein
MALRSFPDDRFSGANRFCDKPESGGRRHSTCLIRGLHEAVD